MLFTLNIIHLRKCRKQVSNVQIVYSIIYSLSDLTIKHTTTVRLKELFVYICWAPRCINVTDLLTE